MKIKSLLLFSFLLFVGMSSHARENGVFGKVYATDGPGILILQLTYASGDEKFYAVTNYTGSDATLGKHISIRAHKIGIYHWGDVPLELWDATPPETDLGKIAMINKTNAANGRVYVQNARNILAGLQNQQSEIQAKITKLEASGAITNAAGTNSLLTLQRQEQTVAGKIQSQQQAVQNLENFYHLE